MIFFTADWHLDHENIIKYCARPFDNVGEMNDALLDNAISVLSKHDTLYMLGDFAWDRDTYIQYKAALDATCTVYYLEGNHDARFVENDGLALSIRHNHRRYYLCHYPMHSWPPNSTMLHGHSHGTLAETSGVHRYDVGVDTNWGGNKYFPVSIEQVIARQSGALKRQYPTWVCHPCGVAYGNSLPEVATWHDGTCDICGKYRPVTEPRDFGHLNLDWQVWERR